ncbi:MAG: hypothetical protein WC277_05745 [Bacilli bacterium]|jgi:hypothetical protein
MRNPKPVEKRNFKGLGFVPVVHLQGIGPVPAVPASSLRKGDITIWNYGGQERVLDIETSPSGKTAVFRIESIGHGTLWDRRMNLSRYVAVDHTTFKKRHKA